MMASELRNLDDYSNFRVRAGILRGKCRLPMSASNGATCDNSKDSYALGMRIPVYMMNVTEVRAVMSFPPVSAFIIL